MTQEDKKVLEAFEKVIPELSTLEKEKLISFGEGMAFKAEEQKRVVRQ